MSLVASLLAPLAMLLPAAGRVEQVSDVQQDRALQVAVEPIPDMPRYVPIEPGMPFFDASDAAIMQMLAESFVIPDANQVRIEQRITIRITPQPSGIQPNMLADLPNRPVAPRLVERGFGRCVPIAGIAGVEASMADRLVLYLRDRRVVTASLERSCSPRDFYSGFYLDRNSDGQLCVNRDTLRSRNGVNCKFTRFRQLVEAGQ